MNTPPFQPSYDSDEADALAAAATTCGDCGRTFKTAHALAIHQGRAHKPEGARPKVVRPIRNDRPPAAADALRELVAKLDRRAELDAEYQQLARDIDELQTRLVKAWQR